MTLTQLIGVSASALKFIETKFATDSSGFSVSKFDRWVDERGREVEKRQWVKASIMVGTKTNVVTAVEIIEATGNDSPTLPDLLNETRRRFVVKEVSADKSFSSVANLEAVDGAGAVPLIPFKINATGDSGGPWKRMFHYYHLHREKFLKKYRLRSNVESSFSIMKRKFGDAVKSKSDVVRRNEVLAKILCHNICCVIQSMFDRLFRKALIRPSCNRTERPCRAVLTGGAGHGSC